MKDQLSRRNVLRGIGGLSLAVFADSLFAGTGWASLPATATAFATLRSRWVDQLTGRTVIVGADPDFDRAIATLDTAVGAFVTLLDRDSGRRSAFTDLSLDKDADVVTTFTRLAQMSTAWATPNSKYRGDGSLLADIRSALSDVNLLCYNSNKSEQGNWWSWEIGSPKALADTLVLLHDELSAEELKAYCDAIDHFVPDPWQQFPPTRGKITSVGANRVDLCQAVIIRSLAGEDAGKLEHAVAGLSDVWQYVTSGNGFFRDGSFIQHGTTPYTGSYGVVLLSGLSRLFALLADSEFAISDPSRQNFYDTVEGSFSPLIANGAIMDSVRGRSISRENNTGYDLAATSIEAILLLARAVDATTALRWRGLCAGWIARNDYAPVLEGASVSRTALVKDLQASGVPATAEPVGHTLFPSMDRTTHRGPGWALSTGMCSNRISWYECGNGENNRGYHTGSGMTYFYTSDLGQYDDAYWATANLCRLPGITVDTTPLPEKVEGEWGGNLPANDWTGGTSLGTVAGVGQHVIGPGGTGLSARKSWFVNADVVVALGSDIHTSSSAAVESVVDHRNLHQGHNVLTASGGPVASVAGASVVLTDDRWVHLEGFGGYVVLDAAPLTVLRETRKGSWSEVNIKGSTTVQSRNYATLYFDHGASPQAASYSYLVAPGASVRETEKLARTKDYTVLRNDGVAQGVEFRKDKLTAVNFWKPGRVAELGSSAAACVVFGRHGNQLHLSVSEPTQKAGTLTLTLPNGRWKSVSAEPGIRLGADLQGHTTLTLDTGELSGETRSFVLERA